jgi:hypothetical protein
LLVVELEAFEVGGAFVVDDLGMGVDAGTKSVSGGAGLALRGARSGGFACVAAVGRDLFLGRHAGRIAGAPRVGLGGNG